MASAMEYVKRVLEENDGIKSLKEHQSFRNRYLHIKRVYHWMKEISDGLDVNHEALHYATIFHDAGYSRKNKILHALLGKNIFLTYAEKNGLDEDLVSFVCYLIENHSNKELLKENVPLELIILLEADMLDEEGALAIVWDCMSIGDEHPSDYIYAYETIKKFSGKIVNQNPMVTSKAKEIWERKKQLTRKFIEELEKDLWLGVRE